MVNIWGISFSNKYSHLSNVDEDEDDEDEGSEEEGYPFDWETPDCSSSGNFNANGGDSTAVDVPFDLIEELELQEQLLAEAKDREWEQVIHKTKNMPAQLYMTRCIYRYICTYGLNCHFEHGSEEKQVFSARKAARKVGKVQFRDNKYRTELCTFNVPHDREACPFAHGDIQLLCKRCYECGHGVDICPITKTTEDT